MSLNRISLKLCLFIAVSLLTITIAKSEVHSGIKFAFDVELAKLVQNLDLTKLLKGKSLITKEIKYEKKGAFGYMIDVKKVIVDTLKTPEVIEIISTPDASIDTGVNGRTELTAKNMVMTFLVDFDARISLAKDSVKNATLLIVIDKIDGEYYFKDGQVHFSKFSAKVGKVDIKFNSVIFKALFAVAKGLIVGQINKMIPTAQEAIEKALNKIVNEEMILKVPSIEMYFDATNVDKPELDFYTSKLSNEEEVLFEDLTKDKVYSLFQTFMTEFLEVPSSNVITKSEAFDYLNVNNTSITNNVMAPAHTSTILKAGIRGKLYDDPKHELKIHPAVNMAFSEDCKFKHVNLLISDYTINTVLYVIQSNGFLNYKLTNSTPIEGLPFHIDTDGMSTLLPELQETYKKNRKVELTIDIPYNAVNQPRYGNSIEKSQLKATFNLNLAVQESDDDFDDAVVVVAAEADLVMDFVIEFVKEKLEINIIKIEIPDLRVSKQTINPLDTKRFKNNLNSLLFIVNDMIKTMLKPIDISALIEKYLPFHLSGFDLEHENGYLSVAFNINRK